MSLLPGYIRAELCPGFQTNEWRLFFYRRRKDAGHIIPKPRQNKEIIFRTGDKNRADLRMVALFLSILMC